MLDADSDIGGDSGLGIGMALLVFQAGATIACGLACLARRRLELVALGGLVAAGLAIILFALAIWLEIDDETYAKIAGIAYVWSFFGLIVLGLTLATHPLDRLARALYLGAVGASLLGGVLATALVAVRRWQRHRELRAAHSRTRRSGTRTCSVRWAPSSS